MALVRALGKFPTWLQSVMKNVFFFFGLGTASGLSKVCLDYGWLSKQDVSLMCLTYLSSEWFAYHEAELPRPKLQFDLQGAIYFEGDGIVIEGGEVMSSSKGEPTPLIKCFH